MTTLHFSQEYHGPWKIVEHAVQNLYRQKLKLVSGGTGTGKNGFPVEGIGVSWGEVGGSTVAGFGGPTIIEGRDAAWDEPKVVVMIRSRSSLKSDKRASISALPWATAQQDDGFCVSGSGCGSWCCGNSDGTEL
jgi:hypothetical protein